MTIEEKRNALYKFCYGRHCLYDDCPLYKIETPYGCFGDASHTGVIEEHYDLVFGKTETTKDNVDNPYWERICKLQDKQREKGIKTYGQGLEDNHEQVMKRIQHIQEELIDGLMYLEWLKDALGGNIDG